MRAAPRTSARTPGRTRLLAGSLAGTLAVLVGLTAAGPAVGDPLDDQRAALQAQQQQKDQEKADAQAALEGLSAQYQQTALDLQAVEQQLPVAQAALAAAEATLAGYEREAALIAARLQDAQDQESAISSTIDTDSARADEIRAQIGQMARQAYQGGPGLSGLSIVVGAETVEDFTEQYGLANAAQRAQSAVLDELADIEADNRNSAARLTAVRERITELKADADQKVAEAEVARQEAADRQAEVERLVAEQAAKKAQLESQKAAAQAEVNRIDAEAATIRAQLEAVAAQQRAAAAAAAAAAGKPAPVAGSVGGSLFGNPTSINPIHVTSEYGMRLHPLLGYYRLHAGIDLRTYCGTPIYAGREGTVQWAQWRSGFGNQVMVDHGLYNGNSLMTSYNHMTSFVVGGGQHVDRGQLLGYSGNTGTSAACHLHFEVYVNGATVNPRPLLGL
jgi:murein DD-endopeptidase MepM/ murein hydrolase activator NlpD